MKPYRSAWLKAGDLLAALPLFSGCSFFVLTFLRNTTAGPVLVRATWRDALAPGGPQATRYLPYAPRLLPPGPRSEKLLRDSLPARVTPQAIALQLPPHSTLLVSYAPVGFTSLGELRLQRADSSVQVVDSAQLAQALQFRLLGGARAWYDIR